MLLLNYSNSKFQLAFGTLFQSENLRPTLTLAYLVQFIYPGPFRLSGITFAAAGHGYSGAGDRGCCGDSALKDFWRYSTSTDTWTMRNDVPDESIGYNGTGAGSNGYTVQGFGPTQMSEYDPGSDRFLKGY